MAGTPFLKMHGLGNDFVVLDARTTPLDLTPPRRRAIADRRLGVGCDQLIVLEPPTEPRTLDHLELQHQLAEARRDATAAASIRRKMLEHPRAAVPHLEHVAGLAQRAGDLTTAIEALQRAEALGPVSPSRRSWLVQLGSISPDADFAAFRRDGKALATSFQPGEGERGASTTVVFDQRILVVHPDGSVHTEVHTLRRVNDHECYYYSRLDFPWPVNDRDVIMHSRLEQDPVTKAITAVSEAAHPATVQSQPAEGPTSWIFARN